MNEKIFDKKLLKYLIWLVAAVLIVLNFKQVLLLLSSIFDVCFPLFLGCIIAYALNIVMKKLEKILFPKAKKSAILRLRRIICILLSIILVTGIAALVIILVVPELLNAFLLVGNEIPEYFNGLKEWLLGYSDQFPIIGDTLDQFNIDWESALKNLGSYALSGVGSIFGSAFNIIGAVGSGIIDFVIALVFSFFILSNKEKLSRQVQAVIKIFVKERFTEKFYSVLKVADETFSHYISGQCVEAAILGTICMSGMLILGFPYAPMVGAVVGITALVPIVGAYFGTVVGAFMILTVDPMQALFFIIFIIVLQQIENNLIYPNVVGSSIGLPGIWVLAAITIGGGLAGIGGMIIGVPTAATLYKLLQAKVREKAVLQKE